MTTKTNSIHTNAGLNGRYPKDWVVVHQTDCESYEISKPRASAYWDEELEVTETLTLKDSVTKSWNDVGFTTVAPENVRICPTCRPS